MDQLHNRMIDWLLSSVIGAVLSVVLSLLILRQDAEIQIILVTVFLCVILCALIYFVIQAGRYKRLLDRLGIVSVIKREGNLECDLPTNCRVSYKYLGMSAVHVLTDTCASRLINNRRARTLEVMHLDPTSNASVRAMAQIEEREPIEIQDHITSMIKVAKKINRHNCPTNVRLVPHPLIPAFRISILDDDKMYVGEYSHKSFGYFSDLIVLKNRDDRPSLFTMFQSYYERTHEFAVFHEVSRTVIPMKFNQPSITLPEILNKVTTELHGTPVEHLITIEMLQDVLHEYHLDNPITQEDG